MQLVFYLILQTESTKAENPSIKKSLFPLFSTKNHLKHSSSLKKIPVITLPMVLTFKNGSTELKQTNKYFSKFILLTTTACIFPMGSQASSCKLSILSQFHKFKDFLSFQNFQEVWHGYILKN